MFSYLAFVVSTVDRRSEGCLCLCYRQFYCKDLHLAAFLSNSHIIGQGTTQLYAMLRTSLRGLPISLGTTDMDMAFLLEQCIKHHRLRLQDGVPEVSVQQNHKIHFTGLKPTTSDSLVKLISTCE